MSPGRSFEGNRRLRRTESIEEFSVLVQRGTILHLLVLQDLVKECDLVTIHSWLRWLVPGSALLEVLRGLAEGGEECDQFDREKILQ